MSRVTGKLLMEKYKEALEGMYMESGKWSLPAEDCTVVVGQVGDKHGREVQVQIKVTADGNEWIGEDRGSDDE